MDKTKINNADTHKKDGTIVKDLSNNNKIVIYTNQKLKNNKIFPLQSSNEKDENKVILPQLFLNKTNINNNNHFKYKLDTIINQMRCEKEKKKHSRLIYSLDNHNSNIVNENIKNNKNKTLFELLASINNQYNLIEDIKKDTNLISSPKLIVPKKIPIKTKKIIINKEINSLGDLIQLITDYPLKEEIEYNINMKLIHQISEPLQELNKMIGMKELKNNIVDQIIYFMQELHIIKNKNQDFMHTVIYGPPGTGKTEIAKIIGKIFSKMGVLKNNKFVKATRSDLIAGYLGQTAIKTQTLIKKCLGGVLFIDEAYSLGNSEKGDSFAKECIDTLCESLSKHKDSIMVIIAGYEKELDKCFFAYNQGLNSRFPWRFKTDDYDAHDLNLIFKKKIYDAEWSLKNDIKDEWFEKNMCYFKYYGRDMETLFSKTKIAHSRRVFCKDKNTKTIVIMEDLEKGMNLFLKNNEVKSRKQDKNQFIKNMYL